MIEIIVNSRSKKSLIELDKIEQVLQEKKLPYKVLKTSKNKNANSLMNEVRGNELIVIGGDGTINEVINNYHGKEIIYLAYGSGNDLARSIRFKKDVEISRLLDSKKFIEYDVGVVNDRKFCSGFLLQGVIGILMLKKYKAKISWDSGEITTDKLYLLNAMIQPYEGGGIKFAPNATGQDGKLHIMIMENMSLVTFVYNYLCLLLKKHNKMRKVKQITTDRLAIKTNQRYFQIDGELINNTEQLNVGCISKFYKLKRMEKNEKRFK